MSRRLLLAALSLSMLAALWQFAAERVGSAIILPPPCQVFSALLRCFRSRVFLAALQESFLRCIAAAGISCALGIALGILSSNNLARSCLSIPLWIIKACPVVALALLALFWLSSAHIPIFVAALIGIPVIAGGTEKGLRAADTHLLEAARMYALSRAQQWRYVRIPALMPFFSQGLSAAYGLIWKAVAAGEVLALPKHGLGTLLNQNQVHLETAAVFAVTLTIIGCGFASERIFSRIARAALKRRARHFSIADAEAASGPLNMHAQDIAPPPLTARYGASVILSDFRFSAKALSVTALVAPSGTGKTTLLNALAQHLRQKKLGAAYLYQEPRLFPQLSLFENVYVPLLRHMTKEQARARTCKFLRETGLIAIAHRLPRHVSGGERQRAALARAFAYPAGTLLMDEAFQSQDVATEVQLIEHLCSLLRAEPRTLIFATHNIREATALADTILVLKGRPLSVRAAIAGTADRDCAARAYVSPDAHGVRLEQEIYRLLLQD